MTTCLACGWPLPEGSRVDRKWCSQACRQWAYAHPGEVRLREVAAQGRPARARADSQHQRCGHHVRNRTTDYRGQHLCRVCYRERRQRSRRRTG